MTGRAAAIAARLRTVAEKKGISFQYATLLYMHEGLLRRISSSPYRERFALKGGLLLQCLSETGGRATRDVDLLGNGIDNDTDKLKDVFVSIVRIGEDDALHFDDSSLQVESIVEGADYHGVRLRMACYLDTIRNTIQVDVGFGDAVDPPPRAILYPALAEGREFSILSYPLAVVVAEKFETMIALADINSRMKDFWDVAFILERFDVPEDELRAALRATFARRATPTPAEPLVFSPAFAGSKQALSLWDGFIRRTHLPAMAWTRALEIIGKRLSPLYKEIRKGP